MKITSLIKRLTSSLKEWKSEGYPVVSKEVLKERLSLCRSCEWWQELAKSNIARCRKCGCSSGKLLMGTSRCPLNPPKWKQDTSGKNK